MNTGAVVVKLLKTSRFAIICSTEITSSIKSSRSLGSFRTGLLPTQSCEEKVELENEEVVVYQTVQDHFLLPPPSIDNDGEDYVKEETFVDDLAWLESVD